MMKTILKLLFALFTILVVNSAYAGNIPENFDVKGYYDNVNFQQKWVSINSIPHEISLTLKAYDKNGNSISVLSIKRDTPVGATFAIGTGNKVIDKIWILPDSKGLTPPG